VSARCGLDDRHTWLWQIRGQGRNGSLGRTVRTLRSRAAKDGDDFYAHRASRLATQRRARRGHSKEDGVVVSVLLGHASRIAEHEPPFESPSVTSMSHHARLVSTLTVSRWPVGNWRRVCRRFSRLRALGLLWGHANLR
jgi:hypothetical protein